MKKIVYILLIFFLFSCSNKKEQSKKETQEQEIMLERERILNILNDKENYFLSFNNFNNRKNPDDSEREEVDISQCTKVTERYFINGIEKRVNIAVNCYDKNGNYVLEISYDENGNEQARSINKYNEKNEIIESSYWWGGRIRESLIIIEKSYENDRIIYQMKKSNYNEDFKLISERVCKNNGKLISEIDFDEDPFFSYKIYNDKNDVVFYGYNHEKSDGAEEEKYDIEYDSHFNKIKIKSYKNENLFYEIINSYNKKNLLQKSVKTFSLNNTKTTELFTYDKKNNLIEEKLLNDNGEEIVVTYYEYDNKNRKIKEGEKRGDYDRYSLYEYSKVEKEEIIPKKEEKEQTNKKDISEKKIPPEREKILKQLREKGDKVLNINNIFEIKIPENIEIVSIDQNLLFDRDNTQYGIRNMLHTLYENKYFFIDINIYGNTNSSIFDKSKTYNLREVIQPSPYDSKNQINYLKENYIKEPFTNKNHVKIGKYFDSWGTDWSSDYYGLYFSLPNNEFNECDISIFNVWGTFEKSEEIDENYKTKIKKIGGNLEKIFNDLELMENSITYKLSEDSIKIENGRVGEQIIDDDCIIPIIDNLRMRSKPSLDGEVWGYMEKEIIYRVVVIGEEAEIGGIKGNWLFIKPWYGKNASWVFSGYTRKPTSGEMDSYFGIY
jgi:hypothetical protein